jgi:uncharacterized lipoprotein YmbA
MKGVALVVCCSLLLLSACSSQPVEKRKYTLHPVTLDTEYQAAPSIALGKIELAPYLRHEGILIETNAGEVRNAKHNLWAESLSYSVRRYLQVELRQALDAPVALHAAAAVEVPHTVDVMIYQMHATESGTIKIVASWQVRNADSAEAAIESEFVATEKLTADGYPELVRGHKLLLEALAREIAAAMRENTAG